VNADIGFFFIPPVYSKVASSPTKLGEFLSSGIPVITGHSIGDVDQLIIDNQIGYIVKDYSETEYKNAINYVTGMILKDKDNLSERCLKVADDYFSLEKGIEKYNEIYIKLANA
jgi:glycosyltransferase involved in cell wall biosynthesis